MAVSDRPDDTKLAQPRAQSNILHSPAIVGGGLEAPQANDLTSGNSCDGRAALAVFPSGQLATLDAIEEERQTCSYPLDRIGGNSTQLFVAIAGLDRFSFLREDIGHSAITLVTLELSSRIRDHVDGAQLGPISRSTIDFTFPAHNLQQAEEILNSLQRKLESPIVAVDANFYVDVTIGVAGHYSEADYSELAVDCAEQALARARATHAKVAAFTENDRIKRAERLALMRSLRVAPSRSEFFLCYQPKFNLRRSSVTAVEALVRWRHPERGLIPPDDFISLAEECDEIRPLTEFVLKQAMIDQRELLAAGSKLVIDINISGGLLADEKFVAWALTQLDRPEPGIGFEITETAVIAHPERALAHIQAFVDAGIRIAIDDYGSGLSSLSYLKQIPAHELKIDKAFVTGLTSSHRDPLLVRSTIELAHALDMEVTAEGVDNARSLALLKVMGCDLIQGYEISKPLVLPDLMRFLRDLDTDSFASRPQFKLSQKL